MCCAPPPDDEPKRRIRTPKKDSPLSIAVAVAFALAVIALMFLTQGCSAPPEPVAPTQTPPTPTAVPTPVLLAALSVTSEPEGARVVVDGAERGVTPIVVSGLTPGRHSLTLSHENYQEWRSEVSLSAGATTGLEARLDPVPVPTPTPVPHIDTSKPIYPIAIMIENHPDARPHSGLTKADVVYEALAEGGISRFMAVYVNGEANPIGPVRSARHYFAYLAAEYNATYVHIGSSPQGFAALAAVKIPTLDESAGDPGFWRNPARYAPHNAYTSTELIRSAMARGSAGKVTPGGLAGFTFRDDRIPLEGQKATEVSIAYPSAGYQVRYVYSPEEKMYRRIMAGVPHRDAQTGEQVSARNVIVQFVDTWLIRGDDKGRLDMEQVGQGEALFFRDGVATKGYWKKPSYGNTTEWYDEDWKPLQMNPGKIWVQMLPLTGKVSF
jgi:hypothetical protein